MSVRPPISVVGSINVDLIANVGRLPGPGETVAGGTLRRVAGGKGANQAAAAARLGGAVRMIGAVGDDSDGRWAMEQLRQAGVDVSSVEVVDAAATGIALIGVDDDGENQIMVCSGANTLVGVDPAQLTKNDTVLAQLEIGLDVVVELAKTFHGYLVVNAAPALPLPPELITRVDLFIVNETEYAMMPELLGAHRVVVTLGEMGASLITDGVETIRVPAARVDSVVSTVGAGDAFCAALVLALCLGASDEHALTTACAVGAAAVGHPASQPPLCSIEAYSSSI